MSLLPEDVPGAVLQDNVSMENHSVLELKRWLECRGLKKQGTKEELIKRIQNCIQAGNDSKIFLGIDGGKWYDAKRNLLQPIQPGTSNSYGQFSWDDNDILWDKFPSSIIPQFFNKGHIYTYIIGENIENEDPDAVEVTEDKTYTTVKPFRRGHQYVSSQHISEVQDGCSENVYVCKCKCLSSFQKAIQYNVRVMLNKTSGAVMKGICECKQSSLGKCSHITALLLFIWEYVQKFGYAKIVGTSKPREWGLGSQKRHPGAIKEKAYPIKKYKMSQRATFDPRPTEYIRDPEMNQFISDLQKTGNNPMFLTIFKLKYENFEYDQNELAVIQLQTKSFLCNMREFSQSFETRLFEIPGTSPQGSEKWFQWRTHYITSSNAKIVSTQLKSGTAKKNFLLKNLWRLSNTISTVAMRYGKENEENARKDYSKYFLKENQKILETGLVVNARHPYFATSIDGYVAQGPEEDIQYLIEIKCPKVLEKCLKLNEFNTYLTKVQLQNFFLTKKDGQIILKGNHPYLYQILLSLIIFERELCHLVVWSPKGMLVVPVYKNKYMDIVEQIVENATKFYCEIYVPEIFTMRTVRDLCPISIGTE